MDFNPIDIQENLKGADYPTSGEELARTAGGNDAPDNLIEQLESLGDEKFSGPDQVMAALGRS